MSLYLPDFDATVETVLQGHKDRIEALEGTVARLTRLLEETIGATKETADQVFGHRTNDSRADRAYFLNDTLEEFHACEDHARTHP